MQICVAIPDRQGLACCTLAQLLLMHFVHHCSKSQKLWSLSALMSESQHSWCNGAGFASMAGAQNSMMEDASRIASSDQVSLDQVQQTAVRGKEHVQGKPVCFFLHCTRQLGQCMQQKWGRKRV